MNEGFGMMDPAYFVGKNELLKWVNDLLKLNVDKIESLGQGAVYCQILDVIYQGDIPMQKVNWNAKLSHDYISNFKVLQSGFTKHKIMKIIEIERLTKCKYQDNLEFIQWFKKFFDLNCGERSKDYDALERRKGQSITNNSSSSTTTEKKAPASKALQQSTLMNKETSNSSKFNLAKSSIPSFKKPITNKTPLKNDNKQSLKRSADKAEMQDQMKEYSEIIKKVKTILYEKDQSDQQKICCFYEMFPQQSIQTEQESTTNNNATCLAGQMEGQLEHFNQQTENANYQDKENIPVSIATN